MMQRFPIALTIAGSDSGGGAGIQADLKTFAAHGVHGATAITCVTAQNPRRVVSVEPCSARNLRDQLSAVFEELPPVAIKTGMLYSASLIRETANFLSRHRSVRLVVDPVMVSTSGTTLLKPGAIRVLCSTLLPLASLVTPNLHETEILTNSPVRSAEDMRCAAKQLHRRFGCAVLVKGGHLPRVREAADIFYDGEKELLLSAPFVRGRTTHGTGCTYSAAITANLARGLSLAQSVSRAKQYITNAIEQSVRSGRHDVLGWF